MPLLARSRLPQQARLLRIPLVITALEDKIVQQSLVTVLNALRRRSQRHRLPWERFGQIANRWIPSPKTTHSYPNDRLYAKHPK